MKRALRVALFALPMLVFSVVGVACDSAAPEGEACGRASDCEGDLYCGRLVMCVAGRFCEGVCVRTCETNAECAAGETCREDTIFMKYCAP